MLTVTEAAARAITALVTKYQMPDGAGLRISRQGDASSTRSEGLGVSIAAAPAEDDSVVESNGVRVFLPANMVNVLADQQIDVEILTEKVDEEQLRFTVGKQPRSSHT